MRLNVQSWRLHCLCLRQSFLRLKVAFGRDIDDGLVVEVGLSQLVKIVGEI